MNKVSIILPVIRPDRAARVLRLVEENAGYPHEVITAVDEERIGAPKMVKKLVDQSNYDLVCFLGDDTLPEKDFLKNAVATMNTRLDGWGLVGFNDKTGRYSATHWLAHKKLLKHTGGYFFNPKYTHCYCDNELQERALLLRKYVFEESAVVLHEHPFLSHSGKEDADEDYKRVYSDEVLSKDAELFEKRRPLWLNKREFHGKVGLCLPITNNDLPKPFFLSFINMDKPLQTQVYTPTDLVYNHLENIAVVRNGLVNRALDEGCDKIIMMDTDQVYPEDAIMKLVAWDVPVIGTQVHRRYPPFAPLMFRGKVGKLQYVPESEMYSNNMVSVDFTGCGCICYDREIFETIQPPWFQLRKDENGKTIGEDIGFCQEIRENLIPIYVDASIQIGHLSTITIDKDFFQYWKTMNLSKEKTNELQER